MSEFIGKQIQDVLAKISNGERPMFYEGVDNDEIKALRLAYGAHAAGLLAGDLANTSLQNIRGEEVSARDIPGEDGLRLVLKGTLDMAVQGVFEGLDKHFIDNYNNLISREYKRTGANIYSEGGEKLLRSAAHTDIVAAWSAYKVIRGFGIDDVDEVRDIMTHPKTVKTMTELARNHIEVFSEIDNVMKTSTKGRYWDTRFYSLNSEGFLEPNQRAFQATRDFAVSSVSPVDTATGYCSAYYSRDSHGETAIDGIYHWSVGHIVDWHVGNGF